MIKFICTGRFISQDSTDYADPETINGLNLYAYCGNNPVMNVDPTGNEWYDVLFKVFSVVAVVGTLILATVFTGGVAGVLTVIAFGAALGGLVGGFANEAQGGSFMAGWVGGALNGAIQSAGMAIMPFAGAIIGGAIGSFVGTLTMQSIDRTLGNNSYSDTEMLINASTSALYSAITSVITGFMGSSFDSAVGSQVGGTILTKPFSRVLAGFFGAIDDAIAYILSRRFPFVRPKN